MSFSITNTMCIMSAFIKKSDVDVDMDENKEELCLVPSAVSSSTGRYEPHCRCDCGNAGRKVSSSTSRR